MVSAIQGAQLPQRETGRIRKARNDKREITSLMLLDDLLPVYDFNEIHAIVVQAPRSRVFRAIKEVTVGELPFFRVLFGIRMLPARLAGRKGQQFAADQTLFEWARSTGFTLLAENTDQELVFGSVGQFWKLSGGSSPRISDVQKFLAFRHPHYAKAATNFYLNKGLGEDSTHLSTETRIYALDPAARKKFRVYWWFIYAGSALIRREWLLAIKRRAEGKG
jgi:hypothetical protein